MKRTTQDYAGRPALERRSSGVTRRSSLLPVGDVASFMDARGPVVHSADDILNEFEDFMAGASGSMTSIASPPDPVFKERLRRRLWRLHLMTQPPSPKNPH